MTLPFVFTRKVSALRLSTRDAAIILLANEWPLTAKEIYSRLTGSYSIKASYQAVHKLLGELEEEKVVEKTGRKYALSKEWLVDGLDFFKSISDIYAGKVGQIPVDKPFEGTKIFKFDNMTDLSVTLAQLIASKVLANKNEPYFICTFEYGFWTFKFKFQHLGLLVTLITNNPRSKNIIRKDTPFGRWIRAQYSRVGGVSARKRKSCWTTITTNGTTWKTCSTSSE